MKVKLYRKNGEWYSSIHKGKGGVSSLVCGRISKHLWWALGAFSLGNIIKAIKNQP